LYSIPFPIVSYKLGLYGIADVIEFEKTENSDNSMTLHSRKGLWIPKVVEYKRGKPKDTECDSVQLCAQAFCLEEMFNISIKNGYIYYGQIRHRLDVVFDDDLRERTKELALLMHKLFNEKLTPKAVFKRGCKMCSLIDICLPEIRELSVKKYFNEALDGDLK